MTYDIHMPIYNIHLRVNAMGGYGVIVRSDLVDVNNPDPALSVVESTILAHACAGINVTAPAYLQGIETVVDAITNNME